VPEDSADLFIDVTADSLHTATPRKTPDRGLRNTLDVLAHDLAVTLRTALTKTLITFAAPRQWTMK
jgi:hypothetical protein